MKNVLLICLLAITLSGCKKDKGPDEVHLKVIISATGSNPIFSITIASLLESGDLTYYNQNNLSISTFEQTFDVKNNYVLNVLATGRQTCNSINAKVYHGSDLIVEKALTRTSQSQDLDISINKFIEIK